MLREMVKWDYEMKRGDQAATVVDRALEIAMRIAARARSI